jgi:hypothetical protein
MRGLGGGLNGMGGVVTNKPVSHSLDEDIFQLTGLF